MATKFLSTSSTSYPLLPCVIPTYNWLLDKLDAALDMYEDGNDADKVAMVQGLRAARDKVRKWYKQADRDVYGICMGEHCFLCQLQCVI
jgi:hypothetical protein